MRLYHQLCRISIAAAITFTSACGSDSPTNPGGGPRGTLTISFDAGDVYQGDVLTFTSVVRDANGQPVPDAVVTWSSSDNAIAELSPSGIATALKAGNARITARSDQLTATYDLSVRPLSVKAVTVLGLPDTLGLGDVMPFGVRALGEGGRTVPGRVATLAAANPAVAVIDPSGRVRAVAAGATTLVVTIDGVSTTMPIVVAAEPARLILRQLDGARLPVLVASDTVEWDGVREYAEVYLETGELQLTGGSAPRYSTQLRYAQYAVFMEPDGQRRVQLRAVTHDRDRGVVSYDARGDLVFTSEVVAPLSRFASPEATGMAMRYRIAGEDRVLSLFFSRSSR